MKLRTLAISSALSAAMLAAVPASSAIILVEGNVAGSLPTVHIDSNVTSTLIAGDVGGIYAVNIAGLEAITPSNDGNGQPWVAAVDGTLNYLSFSLASGYTFNAIEFNLNPPNGKPVPYSVTLSAVGPDGSKTSTFDLKGGNSFFNAYTDAGWRLTNVSFSTTESLAGVGQIRIGGIAAAPEPATWAMMIGGFGMVGFALRKRRDARVTFA